MMRIMSIVVFSAYLDEPQSDQNIILAVAVSFAVLAIIAVAVGIYLIIQKKKKNNGKISKMVRYECDMVFSFPFVQQ